MSCQIMSTVQKSQLTGRRISLLKWRLSKMKLAIVAAFQAFVQQAKVNQFENAKKTVEKNGYSVVKPAKKETK